MNRTASRGLFGAAVAAPPQRPRRLVAEIDVLQGLLDFEAADMRNRRLEIVALLARDAQLVALNRGLDLELAILDLAHDALGQILADALAQRHGLAHALPRGLLGRLEVERTGIDLAAGEVDTEQFLHLAQLQLVIGE